MRQRFVRGALGLMAGAVSVCTVLGMSSTVAVAAPAPQGPVTPAVQAPALQAPAPVPGVKITNTFWYSDRRVAMWVYSPAMGTNIQVQLLLARDWNYRPANKFPQMYKIGRAHV